MFSAYHGHLTSLVDLSTYEFKKYKNNMKIPEHVHIVSRESIRKIFIFNVF
jgi:hypothetical protein